MGEYAYDFTGENVHDGPARNPHDTDAHDRRLVGRLRRRGRGRPGAARARLRHQRLDPRAVLVLRPVRPEADLWPAVARAHLSVRGEPRSSRAAGALARATSRSPTTPCRGPIPTIRSAPTRRRSRRCRCSTRGTDGLRIAVAGGYFRDGRVARGAAPRSRASPRRSAPRARSRFRKPARARAAAYVITASRRRERCISTGCARAPPTSIPPCATG